MTKPEKHFDYLIEYHNKYYTPLTTEQIAACKVKFEAYTPGFQSIMQYPYFSLYVIDSVVFSTSKAA